MVLRPRVNADQRKWEFALRSDQSWLLYGLGGLALLFVVAAGLLGRASVAGAASLGGSISGGRLMGQALYISQCARCHGVSGRGDGPGASSPRFMAPPRDLTKGQFAYVSTTNGVASDEDLRRTVRLGLPLSGMPSFAELSEAQITSLVGVLGSLWINRPPAGPAIQVPPRPAATAAAVATGGDIFQSNCAGCHGQGGRGDGVIAASLAKRPANLAERKLKAGSDPEQVYLRVAAGIPPLMPAFRTALSPDSIWAVVGYVEAEFLRRR